MALRKLVAETQVLAIEVSDRPGGLADIIDILAAKDINIEYMYAFVGTSGEKAIVVFRTDPIEGAIEALQEAGARVISGKELHEL